jgi:hypothetical protein
VLSLLNAQQTYLIAVVARVVTEANRPSDAAAPFMALGSARPKQSAPAAQSTFH